MREEPHEAVRERFLEYCAHSADEEMIAASGWFFVGFAAQQQGCRFNTPFYFTRTHKTFYVEGALVPWRVELQACGINRFQGYWCFDVFNQGERRKHIMMFASVSPKHVVHPYTEQRADALHEYIVRFEPLTLAKLLEE